MYAPQAFFDRFPLDSVELPPRLAGMTELQQGMTKDLLKLSGSWESSAREIDEAIADVVDVNEPIEMVELSRELNNNGYDLILAGDDRSPENIEKYRNKIRQMTGEDRVNQS